MKFLLVLCMLSSVCRADELDKRCGGLTDPAICVNIKSDNCADDFVEVEHNGVKVCVDTYPLEDSDQYEI